MKKWAYYNEIDPFAAEWIRNLIKNGQVANGVVDERSIKDVQPEEVAEFTQCHWFAGIAGWSHALHLAGWRDDWPVWTGSCPCQPFSAAGKGRGVADERHLWPWLHYLIGQLRPDAVFGEQVASREGLVWFDLVQADLESAGYTSAALDLCAAGFGAPHIRQRLFWVAHPHRQQCEDGLSGLAKSPAPAESGSTVESSGYRLPGRLANTDSHQQRSQSQPLLRHEYSQSRRNQDTATTAGLCSDHSTSPLNGFWRDADWLLCRDGKWRPVEPQSFPLVNGFSSDLGRVQPNVARMANRNRIGRLKGYGNAINTHTAAAFIRAYMGIA